MQATYVLTEYEDKLMGFLFEEKKLIKANYFSKEDTLGNVYSAKVVDLVPGIGAAFIDAGLEDRLYYPLKENDGRHLFIRHGKKYELRPGDEILVQIQKSQIKTKKAEAASDISYTGIYLVVNRSGKINVSKKLHDKKKEVLYKAELAKMIEKHKTYNPGFIVRTSAFEVEIDEVLKEAEELLKRQENTIRKGLMSMPYLLIDESGESHASYIKELISKKKYEDLTVITDISDVLKELKEKIDIGPVNIKFYSDPMLSLRLLYDIDEKIRKSMARKVYLKSGGYLIIDPTEALTVIDVNSGKAEAAKKDKDELLYKLNIEAFEKILNIVMLRNMSGIIIVDFMNIKDKEKNAEFIRYLKKNSIRDDLLRFVDMTGLGLAEFTRKKTSKPLNEIL